MFAIHLLRKETNELIQYHPLWLYFILINFHQFNKILFILNIGYTHYNISVRNYSKATSKSSVAASRRKRTVYD